ncbi:hypothetical protein Rhe02_97590 [Rhizocola hellebori]|uniref:Uncharacterized protein n=1 Tax=Rhizocola hellebori TaxID=1392758 RepID=A0A8J3QLA5_9ACTN|nr:hypothetical protein Rhe02_97590 [Rhizocola hellebori]
MGFFSFGLYESTGRNSQPIEALSLTVAVPVATTSISTHLTVDLLDKEHKETGLYLDVLARVPLPVHDAFLRLWVRGQTPIRWSEGQVLDHSDWTYDGRQERILRLATYQERASDWWDDLNCPDQPLDGYVAAGAAGRTHVGSAAQPRSGVFHGGWGCRSRRPID